MSKIIDFIRNWTLPLAMLFGTLFYVAFHCLDFLAPLHPYVWALDSVLTPGFIFMQLLLTFCRVNPRQFRVRRWHIYLLLFQLIGCTASYFVLAPISPTLAQGAMVCMICPTATAAAVITTKLGGNAETLITYTLMVNILAAIYAPLVFPLVYSQGGVAFLQAFLLILSKVFPLLIFPFLLAQLFRLLIPSLHAWLRDHSWMAFYIWGMALAMVMGKTVKSIVDDSDDLMLVISLALISLATCAAQFLFGKVVGGHYGERITAGQSIGQKNTVLAIWMAQTYLNPLASVAPGAYVLWQNIINSYQLWKQRKHQSTTPHHPN